MCHDIFTLCLNAKINKRTYIYVYSGLKKCWDSSLGSLHIDLTHIFSMNQFVAKNNFIKVFTSLMNHSRGFKVRVKQFSFYSNISLTCAVFPVEFSLVPLLWYPSNIARLKILTMLQETCYLFHSYKIPI